MLVFRVWWSDRFALATRVLFSSGIWSFIFSVDVRFGLSFVRHVEPLGLLRYRVLGDRLIPPRHSLFSAIAAREQRRRILLATPLGFQRPTVASRRRPFPRSAGGHRSDLRGLLTLDFSDEVLVTGGLGRRWVCIPRDLRSTGGLGALRVGKSQFQRSS